VLCLDASLAATLRGLFLAALQVLKTLLDAQSTSRDAVALAPGRRVKLANPSTGPESRTTESYS
jgi:hypothetical protein